MIMRYSFEIVEAVLAVVDDDFCRIDVERAVVVRQYPASSHLVDWPTVMFHEPVLVVVYQGVTCTEVNLAVCESGMVISPVCKVVVSVIRSPVVPCILVDVVNECLL